MPGGHHAFFGLKIIETLGSHQTLSGSKKSKNPRKSMAAATSFFDTQLKISIRNT
jgi:hypothetical protein